MEEIKVLLTARQDKFRPAYARVEVNYPRMCGFCGTTNGKTYFRDATGNRRFLPVASGAMDLAALARDRDQIWAEAAYLYDAGEQWHLTPEENALAANEQEKRFEVDALEPAIRGALKNGVRADTFALTSVAAAGSWSIQPGAASVTVREILESVCKDRGDRSQALQNRITTILVERMHWTSGFDPTGERRYFRPAGG